IAQSSIDTSVRVKIDQQQYHQKNNEIANRLWGHGVKVNWNNSIFKMRKLSRLIFCILAYGSFAFSCYAQVTWKRTFGGLGDDQGMSIRALADDGAIFCGSTGSFGVGGGDVYLVRLDINGSIVWSRTIGGPGVEVGSQVLVLNDGGFLVIGTTNSNGAGGYDGFATRLTPDGDILWQHTYGTSEWDFFYGGDLFDDGFYFAGRTFGYGSTSGDYWVVKVDLQGNEIWNNSYGQDGAEEARSLLCTPTGDCIVAGTADLDSPNSTSVIFRVNQSGQQLWATELGVEGQEVARDVASIASGGYVLAGYNVGLDSTKRMFMGKVSEDGAVDWVRNVSSGGNDWEANGVMELPDGNILVAGYTKEYGAGDKDFSLLFLDPDGYFISGPTYGGGQADEAYSVDLTSDGGYYLVGSTESYGPGTEAVYVIRSDGDTLNGVTVVNYDPVSVQDIEGDPTISIYPNVTTSGALITFTGTIRRLRSVAIVNSMGMIVHSTLMYDNTLELPSLPQGLYFVNCRLTSGEQFAPIMIIE
ncbi:MAG: T9SS type A sorting domain-containing protein, partial [Flavobacteriales bacterium]|nr:T9SS type A sorting domain-containing protein [Flavobacteriales bacterium]